MTEVSLIDWLKQDFSDRRVVPPEEAMAALADEAERLIRIHLEKAPRLRPSHVAKELKSLAGNLAKAARSAEKVGHQGLSMIAAVSGAEYEPEPSDMLRHVAYLKRMSAWCHQAAQTAHDESKSALDKHGGQAPNYRLRTLVTLLVVAYQEILGIRPTHTIDPDNGLVERGVAAFVKEALRKSAPEQVFNERSIDELVRWSLLVRDMEYFEPPDLPN